MNITSLLALPLRAMKAVLTAINRVMWSGCTRTTAKLCCITIIATILSVPFGILVQSVLWHIMLATKPAAAGQATLLDQLRVVIQHLTLFAPMLGALSTLFFELHMRGFLKAIGPGTCAVCGYDVLTVAIAGHRRCPECGSEIKLFQQLTDEKRAAISIAKGKLEQAGIILLVAMVFYITTSTWIGFILGASGIAAPLSRVIASTTGSPLNFNVVLAAFPLYAALIIVGERTVQSRDLLEDALKTKTSAKKGELH